MNANLDKSVFLIQSFEAAVDRVAYGHAPIKISAPANADSDGKASNSIFRTTDK